MAETGEESVVEVSDLTKEYGPVTAVDGISFDVCRGEVFALVGPNGAGKTTTVEILECLRTPTSGSAIVLGLDVEDDPRTIKDRIGVVPQSFHTFERLTVQENIELIASMHDDPLDPRSVIDRLDLGEYAGTRFASLSGGWQRRTGIGMALVGDPDVLFLDEPTTGLDPGARRGVWEQIDRLSDSGTTVLLTTHYMDEVEQLADRVALLNEGRLAAVDTVDALVDRYGGALRLVVETGPTGRMDDLTNDAEDKSESAVETLLDRAATDVYRAETGELVGLFDDPERAQDAFGRIHDLDGTRSLDLVSSGMEDVFLRLAGDSFDSGDVTRTADPSGEAGS